MYVHVVATPSIKSYIVPSLLDPAKLANLKHYVGVLESVFDHEDQLASDGTYVSHVIILYMYVQNYWCFAIVFFR